MNNKEIAEIALKQSSLEYGCKNEDFFKKGFILNEKCFPEKSRVYLKENISAAFTSYGNNIVAISDKESFSIVKKYISENEAARCFSYPELNSLAEELGKINRKIKDISQYFLPSMDKLKKKNCDFEIRFIEKKEFNKLYLPCWSNALCYERKERDEIAVGAYEENKLIALAGASSDCDLMWQIGIDVMEPYRNKGIAGALTSVLALRLLKTGKVPFYACCPGNMISYKNALSCGFVPYWIEVLIDRENGK